MVPFPSLLESELIIMALPNLPGNVSLLWALVYMAVGMYLVPLLLSLVTGMKAKKVEAK